MNESNEDKKFSCVCGSEVKETNRKAHEKTKKHTNFLLSNPLSTSGGFNNILPVHNLQPPKPTRKRKYSEVEEDDYEDGDDQDQNGEDAYADEVEDDGFEEELLQAIESIHQGVGELGQANLILNQKLDKIINSIEENRLKNLSILGELRELSLNTHNLRNTKVEPEPSKWINDKCTQRSP